MKQNFQYYKDQYYLNGNFKNYAAILTVNHTQLVRCHVMNDQLRDGCERHSKGIK